MQRRSEESGGKYRLRTRLRAKTHGPVLGSYEHDQWPDEEDSGPDGVAWGMTNDALARRSSVPCLASLARPQNRCGEKAPAMRPPLSEDFFVLCFRSLV